MSNLPVLALIFAISTGQLIKIPIGIQAGPTLLDLTILILCFVGIYRSKLMLKKPPLFIQSGFVFTLICVASLAFTPLHLNNFEYFTSLSYTLRFFSYLFFGWLVYSNIFPEISKSTNKIIIYSGFILASLGILQFIFYPNLDFLALNGWDPHYLRTASTFLDPNFLGGYLALILLILTVPHIDPIPSRWRKVFFLPVYIALITTFSRGALFVFIISFCVSAILHKSFKIAIITAVLAVGFGIGFVVYKQQIATPRNINREQSAEYRLSAWQQGFNIFQQSPILGVGFNSYRYAIREYNLGDNGFVNSRGASSNDSSLLTVIVTTGIIGLAAYLFFLFSILRSGFKNYLKGGTWGPILVAGLLGIIAQSFFSNNLFYPFFLILIILIATKNETT